MVEQEEPEKPDIRYMVRVVASDSAEKYHDDLISISKPLKSFTGGVFSPENEKVYDAWFLDAGEGSAFKDRVSELEMIDQANLFQIDVSSPGYPRVESPVDASD